MRRIEILIMLCLLSHILLGQDIQPNKHYSTHDGLPQIQILDIHQDQRGYIWVSTKKGLAKFNGSQFEQLYIPDLPSQVIKNIYETSEGNLVFIFIGEPSKLIVYNGETMRPINLKSKIYNSTTREIIDNDFYYISKEEHIYKVDLNTLESSRLSIDEPMCCFFKSVDSRLIGLNKKRDKVFDIINNSLLLTADENQQFIINDLDANKKLLGARTTSAKYYSYSIFDPSLKEVMIRYNYDRYTNEISKLEVDNLKKDVYLQSNHTLLKVTSDNTTTRYNISNPINPKVLKDKDNNLWVTNENGIDFFSKTDIKTYPSELISDVWSFLNIGEDFYASSFRNGLYKVDLNNFSKERLTPETEKANDFYYGSSKGNNNNIYLTGSRYITEYDGAYFNHYSTAEGGPSLVSYFDELDERLVVGGYKCIGILEKGSNKILYTKDTIAKVLSKHVVSIEKNDSNEYLLGTYNGLVSFDLSTNKFKSLNYLFEEGEAGAIAIERDSKGGVWIGNKQGLWHLNEKTEKLIQVAKESYLNQYVMALKVLPNDLLTIGSSNEFSVLDLNSFYNENLVKVKSYNHRNGFLGEEVAQSGFHLHDDRLYIPSSTVLSSIDINKLSFEEDFSDIQIKKVNNKLVEWNTNTTLNLPKGENNITLEYEGLGFNRPYEMRYSYKLSEVNEEWSEWTSSKKAYYPNLGSGAYTFEVRMQTASFVSNKTYPQKSLTFNVDIPIYKEPSFYKYAFLSLLGLSILSFYLYFILRRTRSLTDEQAQQIKYLEVQALQAQLNPHFIFNVLGTIQSLVLNNNSEEANKYLISFSKLIRRFLDASVTSNIDSDNITSDNYIPLVNEIELINLYVEFELLQYKNKFEYILLMDDQIDLYNSYIPPMIIQPYVENAIKHGLLHNSKKGKLTVSFKDTPNNIICTIDDDGIGRKAATDIQKNSINMYKSRGTSLVEKRVSILNKLNQNIDIKTIDKKLPHTGTTIVISVDKKNLL